MLPRTILLVIVIFMALCPQEVFGAGKKRQNDCPVTPPAGNYSIPNPVRKVALARVGTKAFQLPNGTRAELNADLDAIFNTVVTEFSNFSPTRALSQKDFDRCDSYLELVANVTTLELNVFELGISFGYTPSGEKDTITGLKSEATVRVGTVSMDFSIWSCSKLGGCSSVAASTASHLTAGADLKFQVDFSEITSGPSFALNTDLGKILRLIMIDGIKTLASSQRLAELAWYATVREYVSATGTLLFDAGTQSRLSPNQSFVVYAAVPATGICEVFKPVAYAHTIQVDAVSSIAIVDQVLDQRGIKQGDLVMVNAQAQK